MWNVALWIMMSVEQVLGSAMPRRASGHAATLDHQEAFAIRATPSEERLSLIRLIRQNFSVMTFLIY
jgi:hypothetical protein